MRLFAILILMLAVLGCDQGATPNIVPSVVPHVAPEVDPAEVYVLFFTTDNCPACKRDLPTIERLRAEGVMVLDVDADANPSLVSQYRVNSYPTYIVLRQGVEVDRTGSIFTVIRVLKWLGLLLKSFFV